MNSLYKYTKLFLVYLKCKFNCEVFLFFFPNSGNLVWKPCSYSISGASGLAPLPTPRAILQCLGQWDGNPGSANSKVKKCGAEVISGVEGKFLAQGVGVPVAFQLAQTKV